MAVTSKDIRVSRTQSRAAMPALRGLTPVTYIITFVLAALAIYLLVGRVVEWGQVKLDDLRYGRPRTAHVEGIMGGPEGQLTRFVAINMNRQVLVLAIPANDPSKVQTIVGPYLFGVNEDLTPVKIELQDLGHDGYNDVMIN
nr:hypothetical protein [Chloroflexaceae bacterium]